jgi:hypothetical protein
MTKQLRNLLIGMVPTIAIVGGLVGTFVGLEQAFTAGLTAGLLYVTAVYAYLTSKVVETANNQAEASVKMAQEMEQTRLESVSPSLSLWPENYTAGGGFASLYLRNGGGVAKNLEIDIETVSPDEKKMLYIPAIDKEHIVYLPVNQNIQKIMVNLTFDDNYNRKLNQPLEIDFSKLQKENRELALQHDPLLSDLGDLKRELSGIHSAIESLPRH